MKIAFYWKEKEQQAFEQLKMPIINAPVLLIFDPENYTYVYCDALGYAIAGWIGQPPNRQPLPSPLPTRIRELRELPHLRPVTFYSRKMKPAETHYPAHEQELLALVKFLKYNQFYLINRPFMIVFTDHKALIYLQTQPFLSKRQVGWVQTLQEFDYKIEYLPGQFNTVADVLSRNPTYAPRCSKCQKRLAILCQLDQQVLPWPTTVSREEWAEATRTDEFGAEILEQLDTMGEHELLGQIRRFSRSDTYQDILMYEKSRLYVPYELRGYVLEQLHDRLPYGGHMGEDATYAKFLRHFYWLNMRNDIRSYIRTCPNPEPLRFLEEMDCYARCRFL